MRTPISCISPVRRGYSVSSRSNRMCVYKGKQSRPEMRQVYPVLSDGATGDYTQVRLATEARRHREPQTCFLRASVALWQVVNNHRTAQPSHGPRNGVL